jgi:hypothetical protein
MNTKTTMKKRSKLSAFIIFGLISLSFFIGIVSAETVFESLTHSSFSFSNPFPNLFNLDLNAGFAQFLLFMLVTLIIYAISDSLPFLGRTGFVPLLISIIIGILSVMYLNVQDVRGILLSYSAFGIALTTIIPFILVAVISKNLHKKGYPMISKALWILLFVSLMYKLLTADVAKIGAFKWIYIITGILVLAMILWENKFYYFFFKQEVKAYKDEYREMQIANLTAELERMGKQIEATSSKTVAARIIKEYNTKAGQLRALRVAWYDWGKYTP